MSLLKKYLQGDAKQVYDEIYKLGKDAFKPAIYPIVESVLTETFKRVSYNLAVIHDELVSSNYCFKTKCKYDFEHPLLKPLPDTENFLIHLDSSVKRVGYVPLSLKLFYKFVGSCNFTWDYDVAEENPWEGADPMQIVPLNDLLSELEDFEDDDDFRELGISADYLHKDNISGGPAYSVEITKKPQIDSQFLNEEHNTTFINYLRIAMNNCGFSRPEAIRDKADFIEFCRKVRPKLYKI
jgi:hypothetical protein